MTKEQLKAWWDYLQDLFSLKAGLYIDAFAVVMLVRLLAPLKGYPQMNAAEAGMWAATITAFAYSKGSKS